jgi:hypothetical protein
VPLLALGGHRPQWSRHTFKISHKICEGDGLDWTDPSPSILLDELLEGVRVNPALPFELGYGLQLVGVSLRVPLYL